MTATASAYAGWAGTIAIVVAAALGWVLRRWRRRPAGRGRMRPHLALGYLALAAALAHAMMSGPSMTSARTSGVWAASAALAALAVQAFVGASLQGPGSYRAMLLGWHRTLLVLVVALVAFHLVVNAPLF